MVTPEFGISLVGRAETLALPAEIMKHGIHSLRLPLHYPFRTAEIELLGKAMTAGCFILAVLLFAPEGISEPNELEEFVHRLKGCITHWEIGSEPDDPSFGWPEDQLNKYSASLVQVGTIIKRVDSTALIHNGGLSQSLPKGIAQVCGHGAGNAVDIWNVHPYINPLMPDAEGCLRYFQEIINKTHVKESQGGKPIWWSSIACPGMTDPAIVKSWWLGKNPTEDMQAEWVKIVYRVAAHMGIQRLFWEGWQDQPAKTGTGIDYFGLVRSDGLSKPALDCLSQLIA